MDTKGLFVLDRNWEKQLVDNICWNLSLCELRV